MSVLGRANLRTLRNVYGAGSPTVQSHVGTTSSSVRLHICAVIYMTEISLHVMLNSNTHTDNLLYTKRPFSGPKTYRKEAIKRPF